MSGHPAIRAAGSAAMLIDCGDLDGALRVFAGLALARDRGELTVDELIPAAETVLVVGGEASDAGRLERKLRKIIAANSDAEGLRAAVAETVIPVQYRGDDLAEVAALTGMSPQQLVARHTAAEYTVAFTGFAPGFAYLSGGDPGLEVPRRATPRPRIRPGSVGLAGRFSGVYPRESPGGWQIIGFTEHAMWDTEREQPAALLAGGSVRFVAEREKVAAPGHPPRPERRHDTAAGEAAAAQRITPLPGGRPQLRVVEPGLQSLIEDAGRRNVAGMGVGESGAACRGAYRGANRLVGNRPGAAAIELGHGGFAVEAIAPTVLAITGAERVATVTGPFGSRAVPHATPFRLSAGERLTLAAPTRGLRTMLGIRGGVAAPSILGSRSRDTLAGLGPEPLAAGDEIAVSNEAIQAVAPPEPPEQQPLPSIDAETKLRVVVGPRDDWFSAEARASFAETSWEVTPRSDRVGVRLAGDPLRRAPGYEQRELPSEGMVLGAIQVPPDGQPVLFLADRPLTGGYPVIAVVHDDDIDIAAQLAPGCRVRFVPVHERSDHGRRTPTTTEEEDQL